MESQSTYSSEICNQTLYINTSRVFANVRSDSLADVLNVGLKIASFFGSHDIVEKENFLNSLYANFEDLK